MRPFIVLIIVALIALSIIGLMAVGLCLGMAYLMAYFVPALDLTATVVPAAILATTVIIMFASVFKSWFSAGINDAFLPTLYDDDEEEDYEPEPPIVTKARSYPTKKNRR
jgi:small-conductance mechanosensitive channel